MIELVDATVQYGGRLALDLTGGPIRFESHSLVAIMGPNGSGKTTLLKLLAELLPPTTGSVRSADTPDTPDTPNTPNTPNTGRRVAYVAQHQHQHPWMPLTVQEVLSIGRYADRGLLGRIRAGDRMAIAAAAERLQIADLVDEPFDALSGGQRQRVLVAMAVANGGSTLLLDEPITGLDLASQRLIIEVVKAERDAGRLVVMTTHHLAEARQCDRVLLLNTTLIADGRPQEVLNQTNLGSVFGASVLSSPTLSDPAGSPLVIDDHGHGSH